MHFSFTPVSKATFPVIAQLFDDSHDDWVGSPNQDWLNEVLATSNNQADIVYKGDTPIGYLQYKETGQNIDALAIFIGKEFRGQGFGSQILTQFMVYKAKYREFTAYIDETDFLSTVTFEKAGFHKTGPINEEGAFAFIYAGVN